MVAKRNGNGRAGTRSGRQRRKVQTQQKPNQSDGYDVLADIDRALARAGQGDSQGDTGGQQEGVATLRLIAADPEANVMARTSAARALAEIEGALGRHALPPVRATDDVSVLSRADLVRELERLRAACQPVPPG